MFVPHGVVLDEAAHVADDLGLRRWWLNEQASVYISGKTDPGKRRVFDHPGLRVMAALPNHIFAMKALAPRTRDVDDLRLLADVIGIESPTRPCRYAQLSTLMNLFLPGPPQFCRSCSADRADCGAPAR
jgi:hypothetical protein